MPIKYHPDKMLKKVAPVKRIQRLVNDRLNVNRAVLSMFDNMDFISKKEITRLALKTVKTYRKKYQEEIDSGATHAEALDEALVDKALLVQRIENAVVYEISQGIRESYHGERYVWLPSSADDPDPEHQLNYGMEFTVGDGEMPGERWGCQCGMEILVTEDQLHIGDQELPKAA
jgi:hypothetical protein